MKKFNFKWLLLSFILSIASINTAWGAAKERYIYVGISDQYDTYKDNSDWGFNFWGGTSEGVKSGSWIENITTDRQYHIFRVLVYDDNNKAQFKGNSSWWVPDGGFTVDLDGDDNNAVFFSASENGWYGQFQGNYQVTSTGSVAASSTSVAIGTEVTFTPSLTSNATYNEIKSTSYTVTTNPNSGASISDGVFTATKAGTYVVTAEITYNAKDFSDITKTVSPTVTITVYATVTFDKEGGLSGTSTQNAIYGNTVSSISIPSKSYYDFAGYWTGDDGTGTEVITSSGAWKKNISNFTDNSSTAKWIILTNVTLHAKWTPKTYTITYKDEGDVTYTGSNGASLPASYTYGTGIASLTDGVKSGYRFDGWFDNSSCTGDPVTSISSSANGAKTFYAKWTENPGGTVTLTAGTGGQVSKDGSSWGSSKSYTGIKTTDALDIYAQANAGYTFSAWSKTSGSGTITSTSSASTTFTPVADADAALTASFTENKVTLTPTVSYDHGSSNYTASSANTVGVATTTNLTCSAPNAAHYTFAGWDLTNLTVTSGNAATDRSITVKITTAGSAIAAVAKYEEVRTTGWYLAGEFSNGGNEDAGWGASKVEFLKPSGSSTGNVAYATLDLDPATFASDGYDMDFKIVNGSNWYGNDGDYTKASNNNQQWEFTTSGGNCTLDVSVEGTYTFRLNIDSTASHKKYVRITYPVVNKVNITAASPTADAGNVGGFDLSAPASNVRSKTLSLKKNNTYTFKIISNSDWYGYNSGAFTRSTSTSSNSLTTSTSGGNMTLTTDYAGDYTFKFNESTHALSVDFPQAHKVTYGKGSVNGSASDCSAVNLSNDNSTVTSNSTWVKHGHNVKLTAPAAKSGYTYDGWFDNNSGTGVAITTNANCTITVNSDLTRYACYHENDYTVTVQAGDGGSVANTSVTGHKDTKVTLPEATPDLGYYFTGWTTVTGSVSYDNQNEASTAKVYNMTAAATVQANFAPIWYLKGDFNSWGEGNPIALSSSTAGSVDITTTSAKLSNSKFKIYNKQTDTYYQKANQSITRASNTASSSWTDGGTSNDMKFNSDVIGDYTFALTFTSSIPSSLTVTYPSAYTVEFGTDGHGTATASATTAGGSFTSGDYVKSGDVVTFSQTPSTGYTLKGWYTTADGSTSAGLNGDNQLTINAAKTVYAQYNANTYAVTFDYDDNGGSKTSGNDANDATYDQATITTPVVYKDGYCLDGWYSAASSGTKVINADGTFVENVSISDVQWTDGDGKWKKTTTATVYAVYTIPTIEMEADPAVLNVKKPEKDTVVIHQTFSCIPTGSYNVVYTVGYSANHTQLAPQPTIIYGTGVGAGYDSIVMPMASANTYEIVAELRTGSTPGSGTLLKRDTINYAVEDRYTVTLHYMVDGVKIRDSKQTYAYSSSTEVASEVRAFIYENGYELDHWEMGVGIDSITGRGSIIDGGVAGPLQSKYIYASNNGNIYLHYKPKTNTVYFFNTFSMYWYSTIMKKYDYGTSTSYWGSGTGAGSKTGPSAGQITPDDITMTTLSLEEKRWMAPIGGSTTNFAFVSEEKDQEHFWGLVEGNEYPKVIYRTDYNAATPMFVPVTTNVNSDYYVLNLANNGEAHYYRGFWVKFSPNPDSTGYYLHVYNQVAKAGAKTIQTLPLRLTQTGEGGTWELTAKMDLEGGKTYGFKITKATGASTKTWYSYNGTLTAADHTGKVLDGTDNNIGLTTTTAGDYTFHVFCKDFGTIVANNATAAQVQGQLAVTVDYATVSGDYRVIYSDATQTEVIASPSIHPRENGQDTVSFFIRKSSASRVMKIQKFTSSWADFGDPIDLSAEPFSIAKDSVYVIYLQQNEDGSSISATGCGFYDGDYYIRTDCVDEHKWDYKQSLDNHRMIPSDYGLTASQPVKFSHYYVHWIDEGGNVKFVVANKYAPCVSDTLITDTYANVAGGNLPSDADAGTNIGASVRFMYNKGTNQVNRAYLAGAQGVAYDANYLKLRTSTDYLSKATGEPARIDSITFTDQKNFVYQAEIKAKPGLTATLTAKFNGNTQYFKGSAEAEEEILGGNTTEWQNLLLTYDFKVNRLICAWQPGNDSINGDVPINADVMVIRVGQEDAKQIVFKTNGSKLSSVKYIYGVIQLNYDDMVGHMYTWGYTAYEFCMYYISFPYDVLVNDIMAPGSMGTEWRLQRYNGAKRAKDGWFAGDGVTTFWEDVQSGDTLHAYEGYSLLLNRRIFNDGSSSVWANKGAGSKLYMYFPSKDATTGVVANKTVDVVVPSHQCEKDVWFMQDYTAGVLNPGARNHKVVDSHWNMIGTPLFEDHTAASITTGPTIESETLQYIYAWNPAGNTLGIAYALDGEWEFRTMYSYMAQYAGTITFTGSAVNKVVAAKRTNEKKYSLKLELTKDDEFIGRTYVELRENAVDSFLLNEDVYMVKNGVTADIYTLAGAYEAGANVLSVDNHIVPVGIDVKTAGTYTFSLPKHFDGEVILVDNDMQTRTNLAIDDYEVYLEKGTIDGRFLLEINVNNAPTAIDGVTDGSGSLKDGKAHKFIMNDQMYILMDGKIYDARGARVQ